MPRKPKFIVKFRLSALMPTFMPALSTDRKKSLLSMAPLSAICSTSFELPVWVEAPVRSSPKRKSISTLALTPIC